VDLFTNFFLEATNDGLKPRVWGGVGGGRAYKWTENKTFCFWVCHKWTKHKTFFSGRGEGQNRSGPKTRLLFVFGYITNGPETRLFFFGGARGRGQEQDFGDNWISRNPRMQVAPGLPFSAEIWRHVHLYPLGTASSTRVLPNYSGGKN